MAATPKRGRRTPQNTPKDHKTPYYAQISYCIAGIYILFQQLVCLWHILDTYTTTVIKRAQNMSHDNDTLLYLLIMTYQNPAKN